MNRSDGGGRTATITTASGLAFDFTNPERSTFAIEDIAHALSNICRFTGHTSVFYSVAQHSVLVSRIVPAEDAFAALMHDAAEAFVGDVAKPLKNLLPDYRIIERRVEWAVRDAFCLPYTLPPSVKTADLILLATEQRDLMKHREQASQVPEGITPLVECIDPLMPEQARHLFLDRFYEVSLTPRQNQRLFGDRFLESIAGRQ